MAPNRKEFSPEQIEAGRRRYELTDEPVDAIAASFGLGRTRMNQKITEWGWVRRRYTAPPAEAEPAEAAAAEPEPAASADPPPQPPLRDPVALGQRLAQVVEHELDAIDRVLGALKPASSAEAERTARTLASLARSLREVSHINDAETVEQPREAADDTVPRDLNQLRRDVGRRLDKIVADATTLFVEPGE